MDTKLQNFLRFPLVRMLIAFALIVAWAALVFAIAIQAHLHGIAAGAVHLVNGLGACAIYVAYVHYLERRKAVELRRMDLLPQFLKGFAIGAGLFCGCVLILWASGAYQVTAVNSPMALLAPFLGALGAATLEEIAVRGVLFRILEEWLGTWIALLLSAVIFGLLHAVNPDANWRGLLGIALEGGVILAAAYVYGRQLWICMGLHCAWNFTDGGVFGVGPKSHSLLSADIHGPDWLTGGADGLDTSLAAVLLCLAVSIAFLLLAKRRGHIMAPSWRRTSKT
jgi:hypothetical protein